MVAAKPVRITVLKKTFNQEWVDEYTEGVEWKPEGCCHSFEEGQEFISDGTNMPEGFSDWAWTDIHKYVVLLGRGGNMLGVKPGTTITSCSDGFRPVFYLLERID